MLTATLDVIETVTLPCVDGVSELSDEALLELQQSAGSVRREVDARLAIIAGELRRRSDRALGHSGLASRLGAASPEKAIQSLTGVSFSEAKALTSVGGALQAPWLAPMEAALASGTLSVASAAAISVGLGSPSERVAADDLQDAAATLVEFAQQSTPEHTAKAARQVRDRLDVDGVVDLEAHRRSRRSLKWSVLPSGNVRFWGECDPESAALIFMPIETVMSPRRGGPRFVDEVDGVRAADLVTDERTNDQLALDTLVDVVSLAVRASGSEVDPARLFGTRSPAVRVHVDAEALTSRRGAAFLEGQAASVSVQTAERYICDTGTVAIVFQSGRAIDVGNTERLHSPKQRMAIAAQWNGCPVGDCDRPPAMTEVHHLEPWNGSNTTLANGISLCRFHHMELHANEWSIEVRPDGTYWMIPPPTLDRPPVRLRSRSPFAPL